MVARLTWRPHHESACNALTRMAIVFCWGLVASAGLVVGALIGLVGHMGHRIIAGVMSLGAGVLLSLAAADVALQAQAGTTLLSTTAAMLVGAATFSIVNGLLASAHERKRCGECVKQPTEAEVPGSGSSIAIGTMIDAIPESLILGVSFHHAGAQVGLIAALSISNLPEALSGSAGMRMASRSRTYVLAVWCSVALATALATTLAFAALADVSPMVVRVLEAFGAGALIAMAAETMIPEAFHNAPRYSGLLATVGFASLLALRGLAA